MEYEFARFVRSSTISVLIFCCLGHLAWTAPTPPSWGSDYSYSFTAVPSKYGSGQFYADFANNRTRQDVTVENLSFSYIYINISEVKENQFQADMYRFEGDNCLNLNGVAYFPPYLGCGTPLYEGKEKINGQHALVWLINCTVPGYSTSHITEYWSDESNSVPLMSVTVTDGIPGNVTREYSDFSRQKPKASLFDVSNCHNSTVMKIIL